MKKSVIVSAGLVLLAGLSGCKAPASNEVETVAVMKSGEDPYLDLYRIVLQERRQRALAKPAPATDPERQALVWSLVGNFLGVAPMPTPPPGLMLQALQGHNLDVLAHVPGEHAADDLALAFINADLAASDPHARYLPPVDVSKLDQRLRLFDEGLGIEVVETTPGTISVASISQDSPASAVEGLTEGSVLLRVQDDEGRWHEPVGREAWSIALSGEVGTQAGLEWLDGNGGKKSVRLTRTWWSIENQRARSTLHKSPIGNIGIVSLPAFYDRGDDIGSLPDIERSLDKLRKEKAKVLIVDLRGNRGGEWRTVMDVASILMPGQRLANAIGPLDRPLPVDVQAHEQAWSGPVWVWVDQHTASGGEILAGALRETLGACVVGERTFGKATMQERIDIKPPMGGQLLISTVLYTWESGNTAQWAGVKPDMWMSNPSMHVTSGERGYPSSLVPGSKELENSGLIREGVVDGDASWIEASLGTPQCKRP